MRSAVLCLALSSLVYGGAYDPLLTIAPGDVTLRGPEATQQLIATAQLNPETGLPRRDWTREVKWSSSKPSVATVDAAGLVRAVSDGEAIITAAKGPAARITVRVTGTKLPFQWSFRKHVIPVFSKMGCNQGACHGALAGKNGFKLTLRGYDPEVDYDTLTRQSVGRRVSLADPAQSLLLLKPTGAIPHGGGKRFGTDSLEYRVIAEWIAAGAPPPSPKDPDVVSLEVFPKEATLEPGAEQQLVVRAKYTDGSVEDVTRWVKFNSNDEGVATVDDYGRVKMNGHGEAAVTL